MESFVLFTSSMFIKNYLTLFIIIFPKSNFHNFSSTLYFNFIFPILQLKCFTISICFAYEVSVI